MSTVIRASARNNESQAVAFNLEDMGERSTRFLEKVRGEARQIVIQAQQEADAIRRRAEQEGRQAAMQAVEGMVRKELTTVVPALRLAVQSIQEAKHSWLRHWEGTAVHVAGAIAAKLVRREISRHPEVTMSLVREALELASGSAEVRISMNPTDLDAMRGQLKVLLDEVAPLCKAEFDADADITQGGCKVETRFGVIDQQFEAQLKRIEEELTQ
jgi:flagellar biosynthesis/type III secretory pathway protein FliH